MHLSVEGLRIWDWSYPVLQYLWEWVPGVTHPTDKSNHLHWYGTVVEPFNNHQYQCIIQKKSCNRLQITKQKCYFLETNFCLVWSWKHLEIYTCPVWSWMVNFVNSILTIGFKIIPQSEVWGFYWFETRFLINIKHWKVEELFWLKNLYLNLLWICFCFPVEVWAIFCNLVTFMDELW